jgi:ribokinase
MVGRLGEDEFGTRLRAGLEENNVNTQAVLTDPDASTGVALILLEASGQNRIVIMSGANARVGTQDVATAKEQLPEVDVVLLQLEIPISTVAQVAAAAREAQVRSVLDAGAATREAIDAGLPALMDVISPNETEAQALTGVEVTGLASAAEAARRLREMGARDVVVKLGSEGAYWSGEAGEDHVPAFAIDPVDTTAAGDAFTACLAIDIASGEEMLAALRRANGAGALACLKLGAQPSMPTRGELESFLAGHT